MKRFCCWLVEPFVLLALAAGVFVVISLVYLAGWLERLVDLDG